jgi:hypothetical protein
MITRLALIALCGISLAGCGDSLNFAPSIREARCGSQRGKG